MKEEFRVNIDYSKYKGRYVAIVDKKVVTSGVNAKQVLEEARSKHPKKEVVLRKIPEEETLILVVRCV